MILKKKGDRRSLTKRWEIIRLKKKEWEKNKR